MIAEPRATDPTDIQLIIDACHPDVFSVLGPHELEAGGLVVRAFRPDATDSLEVVDLETGTSHEALRVHSDGFFECLLPDAARRFPYLLKWRDHQGRLQELRDAFSFGLTLGDQDIHYFGEGTHWRLFDQFGAQKTTIDGVDGFQFAVWAPNARRVSVVGDWNGWDGRIHPLRKRVETGVWELFVPGLEFGCHYKFELVGADNRLFLKSDPFAFFSQNGPATASITFDLKRYRWDDEDWIRQRREVNPYQSPVSVYEVHLGSWKRRPEEHNRPLSYLELADELIPYVKELGFTHIELMPVSEFPFDGSWGYQVGSYFAPTSRFGSPDDFRQFVDRCHQAGIGVIVDWVPAHFPKDAHGLACFDGTALYEHADPRQGEHRDWGTLIFNFGRTEVANFLIANALFWFENYHIDGMRVDAVASMLYLDYSREDGEWIPNEHGGRENTAAIAFMRRLNELVYEKFPGVMMIAEESTAWPGVSKPTSVGGLGFGFKWNMGWMNDSLSYIGREAVHRKYHHGEATFSMIYAYDENFFLVLSHDEVVHGKRSLLDKMPGDRWQKFANLRMFYAWMFAHPGKKLLFMGAEIAQWKEWDHAHSLDWHLLTGREHKGVHDLVRDLNQLYTGSAALHSQDHTPGGFLWLDVDNADNSIFAFVRRARDGSDVYVVINATPVPRHGYRMGVSGPGFYREILNTDSRVYCGSNNGNSGGVDAEPVVWQGQSHSVQLTLPPLATLFFERQPD